MATIPLMRTAFYHEAETRRALANFIAGAGQLSMGQKCAEFETAFATWQGRRYAVLVNSGASANLVLLQALRNLGRLKYGDRVGFSAVTWSTNVMPILQMGLVPVPVDCSSSTFNISDETLSHTLLVRALFLTNALGFSGGLPAIAARCANASPKGPAVLLEDNCEALGAELPQGRCGNFGLASTFSFYVAHQMSTIEGGMVCTDDEELAVILKMTRANGWTRNLEPEQERKFPTSYDPKYSFHVLGFNVRPTEVTGFLGLAQLPLVDAANAARLSNFLELEEVVKGNPELTPLDHSHMSKPSPFCFPVMCRTKEQRAKYQARFREAWIETRPIIGGNMMRQPFMKGLPPVKLPGADKIHDCGFYCGNYPELEQCDLDKIAGCLEKP